MKRRVGIVGFGTLGQSLVHAIQTSESFAEYELAFVWNRSKEALASLPSELQLEHLNNAASYNPDLIVEVAHPCISWEFGERFLQCSDYLVGSPTALAKAGVFEQLSGAAKKHALYVPRGALPALEEVVRLAERGSIAHAHITMEKHPKSLIFNGERLGEEVEGTLYDGPLRPLCAMAPNNVNTMSVLAMASQVGFDQTRATLIANPNLQHHITRFTLAGEQRKQPRFSLSLERRSPAAVGAVTSGATVRNFQASVLAADKGTSGLHFC